MFGLDQTFKWLKSADQLEKTDLKPEENTLAKLGNSLLRHVQEAFSFGYLNQNWIITLGVLKTYAVLSSLNVKVQSH